MNMPLRRDMDMIRDLLLEIEGGRNVFKLIDAETAECLGGDSVDIMSKELVAKTELHLKLLADAKFISFERRGGGFWHITELHWAGCDFIETIRDPEIWQTTKEGAAKAGGFTAELLKDIARGLVKKQLERFTGVKIEI